MREGSPVNNSLLPGVWYESQADQPSFSAQIIPEEETGSTQALIVGIDASNAIGDWYTSDGFLQRTDAQYTIIAGDSLVGNIVQMPFNLSQVSTFGFRYDVKSALVDHLNAGRVLYAPVQTLQKNLGVDGYNVLLLKVNNDPSVLSAVSRMASSYGLVVGSQDPILNSNLGISEWYMVLHLPHSDSCGGLNMRDLAELLGNEFLPKVQ